jgi:lysophospholipase L1-like esterase
MKFIDKIKAKQQNVRGEKSITAVFIGDSVTQGCFDVYVDHEGKGQPFFDYKNAPSTKFKEIINMLYPSVQVNVINSGISGDTAKGCLERVDRDVLVFNPDLVVVSVGLNDVWRGKDGVEDYKNNLKTLFEKIVDSGAECIFMTQNSLNTYVSSLTAKGFEDTAQKLAKFQNDGVLDALYDGAKQSAKETGVVVCDVYAKWKKLIEGGVDVTMLLSNKLNHPTVEMNYVFAYSLIETIFGIN